MKSKLVICNKKGPVWNVMLNRPEKANALSIEMLEALKTCFSEAAADKAIRALTVTGAGTRVFCAGADLSELKREPGELQDARWNDVSETLNSLPVLTIALINGHCIGGAMTLALGCDIRVSVPQTIFSYPVLQNGILPGAEDAARLRALIGSGRTSIILLGGQKIDVEQALAWGLVDYIVEPRELEELAGKLSQTAAQSNREHLAEMKRLCRGNMKP
jgi:enoyl-CoA hydratase/carnithine racemase